MVPAGAGNHRVRLDRVFRSIRMGSRDSRCEHDEQSRKVGIFVLLDPFCGLHFRTEIPAQIVQPGDECRMFARTGFGKRDQK